MTDQLLTGCFCELTCPPSLTQTTEKITKAQLLISAPPPLLRLFVSPPSIRHSSPLHIFVISLFPPSLCVHLNYSPLHHQPAPPTSTPVTSPSSVPFLLPSIFAQTCKRALNSLSIRSNSIRSLAYEGFFFFNYPNGCLAEAAVPDSFTRIQTGRVKVLVLARC